MERETYQTSRQGLDSLNASMQNALDRESALRHELERELKLQTNIRSEAETAMKLMEREVQEKQELMLALRKQLDDLKLVNLEMYQKLQTAEATLRHKVYYWKTVRTTTALPYRTFRPSLVRFDREDGAKNASNG